MRRTIGVLAVALVFLGTTAIAHEVTYLGTVTKVEAAELEVKVIDEESKEETVMTFDIKETTKVYRGDEIVAYAAARIQKDERVAVTVNHDEPEAGALRVRLAVAK